MNLKRKKKLSLIIILLSLLFGAVFLGLKAFEQNLLYFYSTTDVSEGKAPQSRSFRLGGMVVINSFKRKGLLATFKLTITKKLQCITQASCLIYLKKVKVLLLLVF